MNLYSRGRARRSLFDTIGFRALSQLATVLSYAVLVRSMSERAFGVLNLLYSFIPVVTTFGSLGLDHALRRFQPEYLRAEQSHLAAWLVRVVRLGRLSSNVFLIAVVLLAWSWIAPLFGLAEHRIDFALFSVLILVYFQVSILQVSLASQMLHRHSAGSVAVLSIGKLVAYVAVSLYGELTLRNAIFADTAAYCVAFGYLSFHHRRAMRATSDGTLERPASPEIARLKRYAVYSHFNDATSLLTYSETDRWFVAALLNQVAVGTYAFYSKLTEMAASLLPMKLFDNLISPLFFGVPQSEAEEKLPRYYTLLINVNLAYQLPILAFTVAYHRQIVDIVFAGKYAEFSILLPLSVAFSTTDNVFSAPVTMVAQYKERASLILVSQFFGLYQIAAMFALIPLLGLVGAVAASGSFHLFRNLYVWWNVRKEALWLNARTAVFSACVVYGSAIGACELVEYRTNLHMFVKLAFGVAICGIAALVHIRGPALSNSDRNLLQNLFSGRESRLLKVLGLLPHA